MTKENFISGTFAQFVCARLKRIATMNTHREKKGEKKQPEEERKRDRQIYKPSNLEEWRITLCGQWIFCRARADTFMQIRPVCRVSGRYTTDLIRVGPGIRELTCALPYVRGISAGMPCTSSWQSDDYAKRMTVRARVTRHATLATLVHAR